MSRSSTLDQLDAQLPRGRTRRRRVARAYDERGPIELCYDPALLGFGRSRSAEDPIVSAPAPPPVLQVPSHPVAPAPLPAPPVQIPPEPPEPPEPAQDPPPAPATPNFTAEDDDAAVAAAFEADVGEILAAPARDRGVAADAESFLERASAEAPTPGTATAAAEEEEAMAVDEPGLPASPPPRGHEIFDRIRATATDFDAGAFDLERAFAQFDAEDDRALRRAEAKAVQQVNEAAQLEQQLDEATIEDLALIEGSEAEQASRPAAQLPLPAPVPPAAAPAVAVEHELTLVPQQPGYSCWAAAAAMIVAWRDDVPVDPAALSNGAGHWGRYRDVLDAEDPSALPAWGLVSEDGRVYTVDGLRDLLERWGPLLAGAADPGVHVRVVAGLTGDGTREGTTVHLLDPWERGRKEFRQPNTGARYTESFAEFEARQAELAGGPGLRPGIFVAHADRERTRS